MKQEEFISVCLQPLSTMKDLTILIRSYKKQNLRDLRPATACISGKRVMPFNAFENCNGG
jgi:hypothetical protein